MHVADPRPWIAGAPVGEIQLGIVVTGDPHRPAARLPLVRGLPAVMAGIAGSRNRVRAPRFLTGVHVERRDVTADTELAARGADHDLAFGDEWREREVVGALVIVDLALPQHLAGLRVERDDER